MLIFDVLLWDGCRCPMTGVWCNLVNSVSYVEWRAVPCTWVVQAGLLDQLAEDADVIGHRVIQRLQPLLNAFQFHCLGLSLLGSARTKQKTRDSEAGGWRPKGARSMPENIFFYELTWKGQLFQLLYFDGFLSHAFFNDKTWETPDLQDQVVHHSHLL